METSEPFGHAEQQQHHPNDAAVCSTVVRAIKKATGTREDWLGVYGVHGSASISKPTCVEHRGRLYPSRDSRIDLVLYTLTDIQRFSNAASLLRAALAKDYPILVHGLSGAGKTRAILDVLANEHESQSWLYGIYLDFPT